MKNAIGQASARIHSGATNVPIFALVAGEHHEREHGEGQLQAQDHLAEDAAAGRCPRRRRSTRTTTAGMIAISRVMSRRSHGRMRMLRKPSITIWPASVPVSVAFWPEQQQRHGEQRAGRGCAEQRRQQLVGVADVRDIS